MKRRFRLARSDDFQRVRRMGKSYAHPLIVLKTLPNQMSVSRFGISASQSVGSAVDRNRAKRRIRACLQAFFEQVKPGWDLIFLARRALLTAPFPELQQVIDELIKQASLQEKPI